MQQKQTFPRAVTFCFARIKQNKTITMKAIHFEIKKKLTFTFKRKK